MLAMVLSYEDAFCGGPWRLLFHFLVQPGARVLVHVLVPVDMNTGYKLWARMTSCRKALLLAWDQLQERTHLSNHEIDGAPW